MQLIVLWLILLLGVILYSLPPRQTWSFDRGYLPMVTKSVEKATEAEKEAESLLDNEKLQADQRRSSGKWGTDETGVVWQPYMPAEDPEGGLNLTWGNYTLTLQAEPGTILRGKMVSAGYQPFVVQGEFEGIADETGNFSVPFRLSDTACRVYAAFETGLDQIRLLTITRDHGFISPDVTAIACLIGLVGTVLICCGRRDGSAGREHMDAYLVAGLAVFACMPLLWQGLFEGHDLLFHLNRIEGIAAGLRCRQFPVRIHASTLLGYGYAASEFYPELFLYFPAMMRNAGVSLCVSVQVFLALINFATAMITYWSAHRLLHSRAMAVGATALYLLSPYRLVNLYVRAAIGEALAMTFFPLVMVAMQALLVGDSRRWPLLTLSMFCIFMSHLLSTLFAALFCALAVLICLPWMIRDPRRIWHGVLATLLTMLCSLWFIIPMVAYIRAGISTYVGFDAWLHALHPGGLLVGFAGSTGSVTDSLEDFSYTIGVVPGLAIMAGAALAFIGLTFRRDEEQPAVRRLTGICLFMGVVALFMSTSLFPWEFLCKTRKPFSLVFHQIQFPWRFVGVATVFLSMSGVWGYMHARQYRSAGIAALLVLCIVSAGYVMQHVVEQGTVLGPEDVSNTRQSQFEYLYPYTEKEALAAGQLQVRGLTPYTLSDVRKEGTNVRFRLAIQPGEYYVEPPLLYYPGYEAVGEDGTRYEIDRNVNNALRIRYPSDGTERLIQVQFREPWSWRLAEGLSVFGLLCLVILLARRCAWEMKNR
ncbi:MAG: hypothetical protein IJ088_06820 [Clostridia bacterium]|nr:hypothetical protein [Clostridia bacterium]